MFKIYLAFSIFTFIMVELMIYRIGKEAGIRNIFLFTPSMFKMLFYCFVPFFNLILLWLVLFKSKIFKAMIPRGGVR